MNLQDVIWFDTSKGRIGILMVLDWHTETLYYIMGIASFERDGLPDCDLIVISGILIYLLKIE